MEDAENKTRLYNFFLWKPYFFEFPLVGTTRGNRKSDIYPRPPLVRSTRGGPGNEYFYEPSRNRTYPDKHVNFFTENPNYHSGISSIFIRLLLSFFLTP